ncbi:MAG TPA: N-methyl-L-tryptophan oxidase [Burkholderiales bacterium]|nr:N-methyl-L-tryptophan oxidase [Burkholderiales bacterium]
MSSRVDCIVVGLGAMGSAAAYHLARRGQRVIGFDRDRPPHALGSSHGDTRIIREAYFEHPVYVPMVKRAYELWHELEERTGRTLYQRTGGLMLGLPRSDLVEGALRSAREHGLAHELLEAGDIRTRFPALAPSPDMVGVLEPRAGVLFPERCIEAHLELARAAGADVRVNDPVVRWDCDDHGVRVVTREGVHSAHRLVITAGAWLPELVPELAPYFQVERQTLYWFSPCAPTDVFDPQRCPVHLWQFDGRQFFYGFPDLGDGVKVARHHAGSTATAETIDRHVSDAEIDDILQLVDRFVPAARGELRKSAVCLYTNTSDEHFWIDRHPAHDQVLVVSPCSGHGFKFAPVIGEIIADLLVDRGSAFDLSLFRTR